MTVGIFDEGRLSTDLAQRIAPFLSGQRAMHRRVLEQIPDLEKTAMAWKSSYHVLPRPTACG